MYDQLKQLFLAALTKLQSKNDSFKSKLELFLHKKEITIEELIFFIKQHPDTDVKTKHLLGFTFQFYHLTNDNISLYLETKDNKALELKIFINQQAVFQYYSYEEKHEISDTIKIPAIVLTT